MLEYGSERSIEEQGGDEEFAFSCGCVSKCKEAKMKNCFGEWKRKQKSFWSREGK